MFVNMVKVVEEFTKISQLALSSLSPQQVCFHITTGWEQLRELAQQSQMVSGKVRGMGNAAVEILGGTS